MHDPKVVVFEVRRPWPRMRHLPKPRSAKGAVRLPFIRYGRWEAYFPGLVTVWHCEPRGADSGTVCKGMGGSGLSVRNLRWAWKHRHHLRLQVSPWQKLTRRLWTRCEECGQPFRRKQMVISHQWDGGGPGWRKPERQVFHDKCSGYRHWQSKAEERLTVLELVMELAEPLSARDVQTTARLRGDHTDENRAWRVFYDMEKRHKAEAST